MRALELKYIQQKSDTQFKQRTAAAAAATGYCALGQRAGSLPLQLRVAQINFSSIFQTHHHRGGQTERRATKMLKMERVGGSDAYKSSATKPTGLLISAN